MELNKYDYIRQNMMANEYSLYLYAIRKEKQVFMARKTVIAVLFVEKVEIKGKLE